MQILQTNLFKKAVKKLHANQKQALNQAVTAIIANPLLGQQKLGDLAGVRVYKFSMVNQLILLAYNFDGERIVLTLLAVGTHENFYRSLKT